jgi:superfamily II DNA/RNA helicase
MNDFKLGCFRYLVATDVAARGIDVDNISMVVNYDIPLDAESYVHRIGRTGRKSNEGLAITFVTKNEDRFLDDIHEYIKQEIPIGKIPNTEKVDCLKEEFLEKTNMKPQIKEIKGAKLNKGIMKLHINAGKKTKMRPVDIVGALCNLTDITSDDIGIINVLDRSTFVEILNNKGHDVFDQLQNTPIKGKTRNVSKTVL